MSYSTYPTSTTINKNSNNSTSDWNLIDFAEHLKWIRKYSDRRVKLFLDYFSMAYALHSQDLMKIGQLVKISLQSEEFSYQELLTESGYTLICDFGFLIAQLLCDANPDVKWRLSVDVIENELTYAAVLKGFSTGYLNPKKASVEIAHGVLEDKLTSRAWFDLFVRWDNHALSKKCAL